MSRYRTWVNDKVPRYVLPASSSSANLAALSTANTSRSSFEGGDRGGRVSTSHFSFSLGPFIGKCHVRHTSGSLMTRR